MDKDLWDFTSIFTGKHQSYEIKNISDERLLQYKKAYKKFKEKYKESIAKIILDIDENKLTLDNFDGVEMFELGYFLKEVENE